MAELDYNADNFHFGMQNLKQYNPNFEGNRGNNVKDAADRRNIKHTIRLNRAEKAYLVKADEQIGYEKRVMGREHHTLSRYLRDAMMAQLEKLMNGERPIKPTKDRSRAAELRGADSVNELFDALPEVDVTSLLNEVLGTAE